MLYITLQYQFFYLCLKLNLTFNLTIIKSLSWLHHVKQGKTKVSFAKFIFHRPHFISGRRSGFSYCIFQEIGTPQDVRTRKFLTSRHAAKDSTTQWEQDGSLNYLSPGTRGIDCTSTFSFTPGEVQLGAVAAVYLLPGEKTKCEGL